MTSQQLYEILVRLDVLDDKFKLQKNLDATKDALSSLVSQPAVPQHQAALAAALTAFEQAAANLSGSLPPSQFEIVGEEGDSERKE